MSAEPPQEPVAPTPESRRWRPSLPSVSRGAAVIALALAALAVGGAALGLSIANRLADDDGGPVAYVSRVEVERVTERLGPAWGYKPGYDVPRSRYGRGSFGKDGWNRDVGRKRGERFPTRTDAGGLAGMVIAIGEVTGVSRGSISVFTILGNDVDISLPRAAQADGLVVGGWAIVMAERAGDGLVARSVRPMSVPDAFRDRAWSRSADAS